ncbi:MAG: uL15 family ribosomal protein, partial [Lentisphaeria bacterium]|nr:uL15 family ribosomal protein [Lentisphaeria bacterium]
LKILGNGEISKSFTFKEEKYSATEKAKIEDAGGTVEVIESK